MKTAMREGTGGLEEAEKNHTIIKDTERGTGNMESQSNTLQEQNLIAVYILLMENRLNLHSAHYFNFRNLPMIAYIIAIQKSKFANVQFLEFDPSEPGR